MKPLPTEFHKRGFTFTQLERRNDWALFKKVRDGTNHESFEVVNIRTHNGYKIGETEIPPSEFYPRDEDWGVHGFTFMAIEADKARKFLKSRTSK